MEKKGKVVELEVDDLYTNQELEEETLKNKVLEEIKKLLKKEKEVKKDG